MVEVERSEELEVACAVLRALDPPRGVKERIEQALLKEQRPKSRKRLVAWGIPLGFVAVATAAAAAEGGFSRFIPWEHSKRSVSEIVTVEGSELGAAHKTTPPSAQSADVATKPEIDVKPEIAQIAQESIPAAPARLPAPSVKSSQTVSAVHDDSKHESSTVSSEREAEPLAKSLPSSELALLVQSYEHARALGETNPRAGLLAFQRLRHERSSGALAAEIDLQIIRLLSVLGDRQASEREARDFVAKYPDNPKAAEVRKTLSAEDKR